jgi:hypothetical protein
MSKMPDAEDTLSPPPGSTPSEMFPVLTSAQQARETKGRLNSLIVVVERYFSNGRGGNQ